MRALIVSAVIAVLIGVDANADEVFDNWKIFPGPNPEAADLLPGADPDMVFRIGHIIFEYPYELFTQDDRPVRDLSELQTVQDVVQAATPGPAVVALVDQQMVIPHDFRFDTATVFDRGENGFMWRVTYAIFSTEGPGAPYRYQTVLDGRGNRILPQLTVFDAFFHSPKEGWTCSLLQLPASPTAKDAALAPEEIRNRATESLLDAMGDAPAAYAARSRMVFHGQERTLIPIATDPTGKLMCVEIWCVNFCDPARKMRSGELFTVWVTSDGRTAEIQHLDHCWDADEPKDAGERG